MKILHLCLSNWFVDGVGYQENELVRQHIADGHEVLVVASTETHSKEGKLTYTIPSTYLGIEGARIVRIPYRRFLPEIIMRKLRIHRGLREILESFTPDTILFHGTCGWELTTVNNYIIKKPTTLFYIDSHEDKYNSARSWLSKEILHRLYYSRILHSVLPQVKKILCYSLESIEFVCTLYRVPSEKLELFPLGGRPVPDDEYYIKRITTRQALNLKSDDILMVQSGKLNHRKKILDSIESFRDMENNRLYFKIVGVVDKKIKDEFYEALKKDDRVDYLGWKSLDELTDILCAADVYLQPGTQSVTMQHSLCCRCAVILDDVRSHHMYVTNNGWLVGRDGSLQEIFHQLVFTDLESMKTSSYNIAKKYLDYRKLAKRIYY